MKILKLLSKRIRKMPYYKIYWHRLIPFAVAEVLNPEWKKLLPLIEAGSCPLLAKMYTKNGNWYILEGLDLFIFGLRLFSNSKTNFLFNDSLHLRFQELSDKKRWELLVEIGKENIDDFWKNFYNKFKIKKK